MKLAVRSMFLVTMIVVGAGCASKKTFQNKSVTVAQSEVASIRVNWIKDKGKKFDIELAIVNEIAQPIIIQLAEIRCARGNVSGELKHTFFNTGERKIDFKAREAKTFRMVCRTGVKVDGPYQIEISRVFSNPSGDGRTLDKVIGTSIAWTGQP